ncbi:MAG: TlpA family protein disulfide reductase [Planctomycetaceae bacterium]|nr:TlpA family protein disulfide reductase [Planctomycetaceae bacterium]
MQRMALTILACAAATAFVGGTDCTTSADEKPAAKSAEAPKVTLQIASWEETLKLVAKQKGKVVVLDAWSTSCSPCLKEFPNLVKLHKRHAARGVVCMSMSCDYAGITNKPPEFYKEKVLKFLEKQEATFTNILSNVDSEDLFDQMKLSSIPAVYVFGRDGKLVKRFDNDKAEKEEDNFTYDDVTKLVDELLAKKQ